ncbi:MAG: NPCBM/NEW2 domain-containing protein [Trueperaceae bacterium]
MERKVAWLCTLLIFLSACANQSNPALELEAEVVAPLEVSLRWNGISGSDSYQVERKAEGGNFTVLVSSTNQTAYADKEVEEGKTYTYRLIASVEGSVIQSKEVSIQAAVGNVGEPESSKEDETPKGPQEKVALSALTWSYAQDSSNEPQKDLNDAKAALTVGGKKYGQGVGGSVALNANSEVMYALNGDCTTFQAKVGLDDATTSQNTVIFQVFADGVKLWESGAVKAKEAPKDTGSLNVSGRSRLVLLARVDEGDASTLYANWLEGSLSCAGKPDAGSEAFVEGSWGEVFDWQGLVATHLANLPDGRVLSWSSWDKTRQGGSKDNYRENTKGYVWNPNDNSFVEMNNPQHDMFCAGLAILPNGDVLAAGGGNETNLYKTSVFEVANGKYQWRAGPRTNRDHWYGTAVTMPNGSVFLTMGSDKAWNSTEVLANPTSPSGTWDMLDSADTGGLLPTIGDADSDIPQPNDPSSSEYEVRNWYPYLNVAPNGKLFNSGPAPRFYEIDLVGEGSVTEVGSRDDQLRTWGTYVMYDEGKILVSGGSVIRGEASTTTNSAMSIDLTGATLGINRVANMNTIRSLHSAVMLPTGEALMVGGNTTGAQFTSENAILESEVWNPETNTWRTLAPSARPRAYHSAALLLPDGRVLAAGGGLCGQNGCAPGVDEPNGEIYSPPYLFNADGSLATRPVIKSAPQKIGYNVAFNVTMEGDDIEKFSLIRLSSITHGINTDLRYLSVPFTKSDGGTYTLTSSSNPNVLVPGYYFLFAVDSKGVPSVSKTVLVAR